MKTQIKFVTERLTQLTRSPKTALIRQPEILQQIQGLRENGFVVLNHLVGSKKFERIRKKVVEKVEKKFDLEFPCLAQSKIDAKKHSDLISQNFLSTSTELEMRGVTFDGKDVKSYEQMVNEFKPSTLKVAMPPDAEFYELWLDPTIVSIVSGFMGFYPELKEAYIRRNFPCKYPVMNHNWHRDTNHKTHLIKAFIFFTDCDIRTGAHHYIKGSANDPRHRQKKYFSDKEIFSTWPENSEQHVTSTVKAGTVIIEDTRGLHKAGIPKFGFRDLGFAVFLPANMFFKQKPMYRLTEAVFNELSPVQKRFVPKANIERD